MKTKYLFQLLLGSFLFLSYSISAQSLSRQTICSSGSSNSIDKIFISQTIGQSYNTTTNYNNGMSFRPGFQQPTAGYKNMSIGHTINLQVFPNPVINLLTIQSPVVIPTAIISVIDVNGKVVYADNITNFKTGKIDCQQLANGSYVVSISDGIYNIYSTKLIVNHY